MQTITAYLKGIVPHLEAQISTATEQEQQFINNLLKEIAELPANQGEENDNSTET